MPETHDLDRAFEALAHDVMDRTAPLPARAAIGRARRRRRTTFASLAVAGAVVVAGVSVPVLGADRLDLGFADRLPEPAPLDAASLNEATAGWISGWSAGMSPDAFSAPGCRLTPEDPAAPATQGTSHFAGDDQSGAVLVLQGFTGVGEARAEWDAFARLGTACDAATRTEVPDYPGGTEVLHLRIADGTDRPVDPGAALTDVWIARSGDDLARFETTSALGSADQTVIDAVSDALVAGMLDGSVQTEEGPVADDVPLRPQLPPLDSRDLTAALGDWRSAARVEATSLPATPCLPALDRGVAASSQASPRGHYIGVNGYPEDTTQAADELARAVEALRDCGSVTQQQALPGGVAQFTYDVGGPAGHGAVWLAANEDRVMVVSVDGVAEPLPDEVGGRVGGFLTDVLALPWPGAS